MAGRPKKPLALVRLEGNPGKRKLPKKSEEIAPDPAHLSPPDWLGATAKREWLRIEPELFALGLLSKVDMAALVCYCDAYEGLVEAKKAHLPAATKKAYYDVIHKFCSAFGMTPSSRAKMSI